MQHTCCLPKMPCTVMMMTIICFALWLHYEWSEHCPTKVLSNYSASLELNAAHTGSEESTYTHLHSTHILHVLALSMLKNNGLQVWLILVTSGAAGAAGVQPPAPHSAHACN